MKKIKIYQGAAIVVDDSMEKWGAVFSTNTGPQVDEVKATAQNIKKYIRDKKYPKLEK